jgi:hypothetical protein
VKLANPVGWKIATANQTPPKTACSPIRHATRNGEFVVVAGEWKKKRQSLHHPHVNVNKFMYLIFVG